jgi:hypothetical protein
MKKKNIRIAFEELNLNIKHQKIDTKKYSIILYQFDEDNFVGSIFIPLKINDLKENGSE